MLYCLFFTSLLVVLFSHFFVLCSSFVVLVRWFFKMFAHKFFVYLHQVFLTQKNFHVNPSLVLSRKSFHEQHQYKNHLVVHRVWNLYLYWQGCCYQKRFVRRWYITTILCTCTCTCTKPLQMYTVHALLYSSTCTSAAVLHNTSSEQMLSAVGWHMIENITFMYVLNGTTCILYLCL